MGDKLKQKEDKNEDGNIKNEINRLQQIDAQQYGQSKSKKRNKKKNPKGKGKGKGKGKQLNAEQQNALKLQSKENEGTQLTLSQQEHGHVFEPYMKKLKEGLLMHDSLKTAENAVIKTKKSLSDELELEQAHKKQSMMGRQQHANPFGGAFGGSLFAPHGNPYYDAFKFALMPPPPPMPFEQFMQGRQEMNPLLLPEIPGLQGRYASRRRRRLSSGEDVLYTKVIKCIEHDDDAEYMICFGYDWDNDLFFVDFNLLSGNGLESGYYFVYDFHFEIGDGNDRQCEFYNKNDQVCIQSQKDDRINTILQLNEVILNYHVDADWNEIYKGIQTTKCANFGSSRVCMVEENANEYHVEMKFPRHRLSNHNH